MPKRESQSRPESLLHMRSCAVTVFPGDDLGNPSIPRMHTGVCLYGRRRTFRVVRTEARASPKMRALITANHHLLRDGCYGSSIPQRLSADVDTPADLVHLDQGVPQEEGEGCTEVAPVVMIRAVWAMIYAGDACIVSQSPSGRRCW